VKRIRRKLLSGKSYAKLRYPQKVINCSFEEFEKLVRSLNFVDVNEYFDSYSGELPTEE
jgi:hypothetical protein